MNITTIIQKQLDDFNRHDIDAFVAPYTPDATSYDPYYEQPLQGLEAIRKDVANFNETFLIFRQN